jgi:hypothetical protein
MQICKSNEAESEIQSLSHLDRELSVALEACIGMLAMDPNEFEGQDGFSIKRIGGLFRRGIRLYRVKYEKYISGRRILFFTVPAKNCVFVTGVHARGELGVGMDYDFSREGFVRAIRYWGMKDRLC